MERLLEQKLAINVALQADKRMRTATLELSCTEWRLVEQLVPILRPFKLVTEAMSGEKYVSSSLVQPCIHQLLYETNQNGQAIEGILRNVCRAIASDLEIRYPIDHLLNCPIAFSTLMDPRFKHLSFLDPAQKNTLVNNFQAIICQQRDSIEEQAINILETSNAEPESKRAKNNPLVELLSKL